MKLPTVKELAEISMAAEEGDPFDWGTLNVSKQVAYEMMANHALSLYSTQGKDRDIPNSNVTFAISIPTYKWCKSR